MIYNTTNAVITHDIQYNKCRYHACQVEGEKRFFVTKVPSMFLKKHHLQCHFRDSDAVTAQEQGLMLVSWCIYGMDVNSLYS